MLSKNVILGIVAGVGLVLSASGGLLSGAQAAILLIILTISVLAGIFFFYQSPKGQACTPKKDDSNVVAWVTNEVGMCVPQTCKDGLFVVGGKCIVPTELPKGWMVDANTSNAFSDSSNVISSNKATLGSSVEVCGYGCKTTKGCAVASFSTEGNLCTLYSHDDSNKKDTGMPVKLIRKK
jgi:hypothetical protein